jgi:hypothetical protein
MTTGQITVRRLLLPALIAVFAIIAAVGAGIGQLPDDADAAPPTALTVGLDMKTTKTAAGTYNINSLPTFEQCVDVSTSVNSGVFYVDIFILNVTGLFAFHDDISFSTPGKLTILGSDVKQFFGTGSTVSNFSRNIATPPAPPNEDNNINPTVNDGLFHAEALDTGATHTGHGVMARLKIQAQNPPAGGHTVSIAINNSPASPPQTKGIYLVSDPGAMHPGDTNGDTFFDGPFINSVGTVAVNMPDGDSDTVSNGCDNCPTTSNAAQTNTDGANDGGDACDPDDDNDLINDGSDNCPLVYNPTQDPAACQDSDGDTILDGLDNCPTTSNTNQANFDGDTLGDVCDPDDDNDGVNDTTDNCDFAVNPTQANWNGNALGDACEDSDLDNWLDSQDNCKGLANPSQSNADGDSYGDTCDNCPAKSNSSQADVDGDFIGDACDDSDGDSWTDEIELFTGTIRTQKCASNTGANNEPVDATPPDTNDDMRYNTLDLVPYVTSLNSIGPNPPYSQRLDMDMNNRVNTLDLVGFVPILNQVCTP